MSKANGIDGIERLEGRGITAKVTKLGQQYSTYQVFADEIGYSDATGDGKVVDLHDRRTEDFSVLAKGIHGSNGRDLFVIESKDGERFIVGRSGLDINYPDKSPESFKTKVKAEELLAEMRRQAYAEGYSQGFKQANFDAEMEEQFLKVSEVVTQESPQQKERDRIVEQAKADVLGLQPTKYGNLLQYEFFVNKEKRTVVALVRGMMSGKVYKKGIAKCAPDDCFNSTLGKAIALRRALGLEVPDEYIYAPQPTEIRVGDIIRWNVSGGEYEAVKIYEEDNRYDFKNVTTGEVFEYMEYTKLVEITHHIDDSCGEADAS